MRVETLADRLKNARVVICGDCMLDHYVFGTVSRISPEAPVPVLHVASERDILGGAGNVAANVVSLGAGARLIGVIGGDLAGRTMLSMLRGLAGIEPCLVIDPSAPTIVKTRYLGGQQQLVRVDRERIDAGASDVATQIIAHLAAALPQFEVFVLSDYGKGALSEAVLDWFLPRAAAAGKTVLVDPKRLKLARYRGASLITPNRRELEAAVGLPCDSDAEANAAAMLAIGQTDAAILLTRSEKGMTLYQAGEAAMHFPAVAREVFDVTGAGDTVVAALAASLAAHQPLAGALQVANAAAGVVVGKVGTATCSIAELRAALVNPCAPRGERLDEAALGPKPVLSAAQAQALRAVWRRAGLRVGFTNGCFDLLHPGHISLLQQSARACDRLIVAINSDASVRRLKGVTRPLQNEAARAALLLAIRGVDEVVIFDEDTPYALIRDLLPDVLIKGADYARDQVVGGDLITAAGGEILLAELVDGHSTTALVRRANGEALPSA